LENYVKNTNKKAQIKKTDKKNNKKADKKNGNPIIDCRVHNDLDA
jgi:hypothetical protein